MQLKLKILFFSLWLVEAHVYRRDRRNIETNECGNVMNQFHSCAQRAHEKYMEKINAGDDGRMDWLERKACNFLTEKFEVCGNLLLQCYNEDTVGKLKINHLKTALDALEHALGHWNTNKCPSIRAQFDKYQECHFVEYFNDAMKGVSNFIPAAISLGPEYAQAVSLLSHYGDYIHWNDPSNFSFTELFHRFQISSLANHFADQMANDIREAKAPNEVVLGGIESPKEYKYEQIFSKETNWKAELEKNRFLYISQYSAVFVSLMDQLNIFLSGVSLPPPTVIELSSLPYGNGMDLTLGLLDFKNDVNSLLGFQGFSPGLEMMYDIAVQKIGSVEVILREAKCIYNMAEGRKLDIERFMPKEEFLWRLEAILRMEEFHGKQEVVDNVLKVKVALDNYIWKEMRPNHLTMTVYNIFLKVRKFLISMDLDGMVESLENIHRHVDHGIWKTMDGQWPEMELFIQNLLRNSVGKEKLWKKLDEMLKIYENQLSLAIEDLQVATGAMFRKILQTRNLKRFLNILMSAEHLKKALEPFHINADMAKHQTLIICGLHQSSCKNQMYDTVSWSFEPFKSAFSNWLEVDIPDFSETFEYLFGQVDQFIVSFFGGYETCESVNNC